jgi:ephrin-B
VVTTGLLILIKLTACGAGSYKRRRGALVSCTECPPHSSALAGASSCTCDMGYYRSPLDSVETPCTRPPGRPLSAVAADTGPTYVRLTWAPPNDHGGRAELWYRIVCLECSGAVHYEPSQVDRLNETSVRVDGLEPETAYSVGLDWNSSSTASFHSPVPCLRRK